MKAISWEVTCEDGIQCSDVPPLLTAHIFMPYGFLSQAAEYRKALLNSYVPFRFGKTHLTGQKGHKMDNRKESRGFNQEQLNTNVGKQYYLPGDITRTPLDHDTFCKIMRPYWAERKSLQRAGECKSPEGHVCLCDCMNCKYHYCGDNVSMTTLEETGHEIADSNSFIEDTEDDLFKQQIYGVLNDLDMVDRLIIHYLVLRDTEEILTERQVAELISTKTGKAYSHQAVHKRISVAAKRLAKLIGYDF